MKHSFLFLSALAPMLFFEAEKGGGGGGGGTEKPPSLDAQFTASQARVTELERLQTGWTAERATLITERDTARTQATEFQNQLTTANAEQTRLGTRVTELEAQLGTANTNVTTLTRERDEARTSYTNLLANPSAQARTILAAAGSPAVSMAPAGSQHPGQQTTQTPTAGLTGLKAATAKMAAQSAEKKS